MNLAAAEAMQSAMSEIAMPEDFEIVDRKFGFELPIGRLRSVALRLAILNWSKNVGRRDLRRIVRNQFRKAARDDGYGSLIIAMVLMVAAEAVVGWVVQKLLDFVWDRWHKRINNENACQVVMWQQAIRMER